MKDLLTFEDGIWLLDEELSENYVPEKGTRDRSYNGSIVTLGTRT